MKKLNLKTKNYTSKGITLIALVITIIVMLILAAVSITMAVNGGLFGYAGNAAKETEKARNEELEYGNVEDNLNYEGLITKYAIVYGDVNLDGKVNTRDPNMLSLFIAGDLELSEHAKTNADVNLDGVIDQTDLEILKRGALRPGTSNYIALPYTGELFWLDE